MRYLASVATAIVALASINVAHGANVFVEPNGSSPFGSSTPPPSGTQEWVYDSGFGGAYHWDWSAGGRTIATAATAGPLDGPVVNQIQTRLFSTSSGAGDVDLFKVSVTNPSAFKAWTGRSAVANTYALTLFAADGTAIASSLGGVQVTNSSNPDGAIPLNWADPAIINGAALGLVAGDYYIGVSNYVAASGKGQAKNDAGQNLFNLVSGSVSLPNALSDKKLSTDPLKAWDLYSFDGGTIGSFDPDIDHLLAKTSFTAGSAGYINLALVPEPSTVALTGLLGLTALSRRRRANNG